MQLITIKMIDGMIIEALIDSIADLGRRDNRLVFSGWDQKKDSYPSTKAIFNINLDQIMFHKVQPLLTEHEQVLKDLENMEKDD